VRAYRSGDGQYSSYSNIAHTNTHLCPPTDLRATASSSSQIDLTWQDNSSDESDFRIERSPNGSTNWTEIGTVGAGVTSYHDSGLSCSTSYYYRVRAYRSGDARYSSYSNTAVTTTRPCPPTDLSATAISPSQVDLTWQDNSSDESDFRIERSPNGSTNWTEIGTVGAGLTSYYDSGLSCSTSYYYRVRAYRNDDEQYSGYSEVANAITHPCAPSNLKATASSVCRIDLTWQDNSSNESSFHLERSLDGNTDWTQIGTIGADVTSYYDCELSFDTRYYYRLRTYRDSDGQYSSYSEVTSATTQGYLSYLPLILEDR
jgi:hypothetical protein